MTIHAYKESFLTDAINNLSLAFDYAINDCKLDSDWFSTLFVRSNLSTLFEHGDPSVISGRSGIELVRDILSKVYPGEECPEPTYSEGRTPEYWAGWALAQYQWKTAKRFKYIFERIPLSEIIGMYRVFHEMDITRFFEEMDRRYNEKVTETRLKKMRENLKLSQAELSNLSGVKLRSIQLYEQRVNDIDKAQAHTLYKLAHVLNSDIEEILEDPEILK